MRDNQQGISNRETAAEEAEERREFPPVAPEVPGKPEGATGSKDADRAQPSAHKVAGADGREDS